MSDPTTTTRSHLHRVGFGVIADELLGQLAGIIAFAAGAVLGLACLLPTRAERAVFRAVDESEERS